MSKMFTWQWIAVIAIFMLGFTFGQRKAEISQEVIAMAEQLIGLEFTPAERDSMIGNLNGHLRNYENLRKNEIGNEVAPAMIFNPLPIGYQPREPQKPTNWGLKSKVTLPANDVDIAFMPVADLAVLIKNKQITSERLTRIYIDRIKRYGDTLETVITLMENQAIAQARKADQEIKQGKYRGPLHGIPYGIKDLLAVKGTKTTWGAAPYKDQVIDRTATVVQKLDEAGAVLVVKLTLGALAMGDEWYGGTTRNPWNLRQGSSGSSAGSASAVSAGLVPFAIGTETLGSIVSPSTRNGVTGIRPTFGRVSKYGAMALSWSMDKIGPIGRDALDCAIVLDAISGRDELDPSTIAAPLNYDANWDIKKMKIGYFSDYFEGRYASKRQDSTALEVFKKLGVELIPVKMDVGFDPSPLITILSAEAGAAFDELTRSNQDDLLKMQNKGAWPNFFRAARFVPAVEYIQANRMRSILIERMNELMKEYDAIITPSFGGSQLLVTNLTGHPAVVMPNGYNNQGSPTSFTIIGNLFEEGKIARVAKAYQDQTIFDEAKPPLFAK